MKDFIAIYLTGTTYKTHQSSPDHTAEAGHIIFKKIQRLWWLFGIYSKGTTETKSSIAHCYTCVWR